MKSSEMAIKANGFGGLRVLLRMPSAPKDCAGSVEEERDQQQEALFSIVDAVQQLLGADLSGRPPFVRAGLASFALHDSQHPLLYGGFFGGLRAPTVLLEASCAELTRYLREDPAGPFAARHLDEKDLKMWGFTRDNWQNSVLKADWHGFPWCKQDAEVFVPRIPAARAVQRAPPRIMAFIAAFRQVNRPCWFAIAETLIGLKRSGDQVAGRAKHRRARLLECIAACLTSQRHFGILEAQVRWGRTKLQGQSHKDGATSLLHLGLTLGGSRMLRIGAFPSGTAAGNCTSVPFNAMQKWYEPGQRDRDQHDLTRGMRPNGPPNTFSGSGFGGFGGVDGFPFAGGMGGFVGACSGPGGLSPTPGPTGMQDLDKHPGETNVWDEALWPSAYLRDIEMKAGSAYLSSPFCVEHGVLYAGCGEEDPVIALQCRFGFNGAVGKELNDQRSEEMREITNVIAEGLRVASVAGLLRMPSVLEVKREEVRLSVGP